VITPDLLTRIPLFAGIPDDERASLARRMADVRLRQDDWLIEEGQAPAFYALLEGRIDIYKHLGQRTQRGMSYRPGEFFGEVPLLLGSPAIASLRAGEPSRVLRLEADDFRDLVASCRVLSSEITRKMLERVSRIGRYAVEAPPTAITVVGGAHDPECYALRDFLSRNRVGFRWREPNGGPSPSVTLADGRELVRPTFRAVAEGLGLQTVPAHATYDVVIIGGGPAGLAAAVYGASEGLRTLLIEGTAFGGQAGTSTRIENYLGFPGGLSGEELSKRACEQATKFGAELLVTRTVARLEPGEPAGAEPHTVVLDDGAKLEAQAVILATGVEWRRPAVPDIERLVGHGVFYGAGRAEARRLQGGTVHLVGGGNSAGQAALLFADYADSVTMLVRGPSLAASMSHYLIDQLARRGNIAIETGVEVVGVDGDEGLTGIEVAGGPNGRRERRPSDALFVLIGGQAATGWLPGRIIRDEWGYVCTGRDVMDLLRERPRDTWPLERDPYLLETSVPGILAAGDVRHGSIKRVAAGVGEGSMSIAVVHQYLAERLRPAVPTA